MAEVEYDWTGKNINDVLETSLFLGLKETILKTGSFGITYGHKGSLFWGSNATYIKEGEVVIIVNPRGKTLDKTSLVIHHYKILSSDLLIKIIGILDELKVPYKKSFNM